MNFDECMKATIKDSVVHALERMKTLDPNQGHNYFLSLVSSFFLILIWMIFWWFLLQTHDYSHLGNQI